MLLLLPPPLLLQLQITVVKLLSTDLTSRVHANSVKADEIGGIQGINKKNVKDDDDDDVDDVDVIGVIVFDNVSR